MKNNHIIINSNNKTLSMKNNIKIEDNNINEQQKEDILFNLNLVNNKRKLKVTYENIAINNNNTNINNSNTNKVNNKDNSYNKLNLNENNANIRLNNNNTSNIPNKTITLTSSNNIFQQNNNANKQSSIETNNSNTNYYNVNSNTENSDLLIKQLAIEKYKEEIVKTIKNNTVTIISGETGCGKTTKVPQYIYHDLIENNIVPNIIITQPRRIAAVSICKRLNEELNFSINKSNNQFNKYLVGYHIRMEPYFNDTTRILICTTGIFQQKIINEKSIDNYSHIIIDEVHERDTDIDLVLIIIKHYLKNNNKTKLILMSATIATKLFSNYFSKKEIELIDKDDYYKSIISNTTSKNLKYNNNNNTNYNNQCWNKEDNSIIDNYTFNNSESRNKLANIQKYSYTKQYISSAPIISIYERLYNVKEFYLQDIIYNLNNDFNNKELILKEKFFFEINNPRIDRNLYTLCSLLIKNIINEKVCSESRSSILVFLPGYYEIITLGENLISSLSELEYNKIELIALHSNTSK